MNILLLGGTPANRGGVEQFCLRAAQALALTGRHRVTLVDADTAFLTPMKIGRFASAIVKLIRQRRSAWDCVWLQYVNFPDLALLLVCRLLGYTVLVTPHLGSNWASQKNRVLSWLGSRMLGAAHAIALISPTQAEELSLPAATPVFHIKTFLPQHFPEAGRHQGGARDRLVLIHAGRLSEGKGSFRFLEICAALLERQVRFSANMVGPCDGRTSTRIRSFIADHGLSTHVAYLGPMSELQLLPLLAQSDVLIHLSDIDSFPLIVLEAIGCGVFPICKNLLGANSIATGYCGWIVDGDTMVTEVADRLRDIPAMQLRTDAASARTRLAADYSWGHCVKLLEDAITDMTRPPELISTP